MSALRSNRHYSGGPTRAGGLTLIEVLVTLVISLILSAGVIQIFIGSKQTYRFQESLSRIQETGRFAFQTMARDIRGADYRGCGGAATSPSDLQNLLDDGRPNGVDFFDEAIKGFKGDGSGFSPSLTSRLASASPAPDPDSDVLRMRTIGSDPTAISDHQSSGKNLFVDDADDFEAGDIVIASDCEAATVFQVTPGGGSKLNYNPGGAVSPGNRNESMVKSNYDDGSDGQVSQFREVAYYVAQPGDSEPGLYRLQLGGSGPEKLVEGTERLAMEFGVDDDGDDRINDYVDADAVGDWANVLTVRMSLLLRGAQDNVVEEPQQISFPPGAPATDFGDRRLRQVLTATATLRNRTP